MEPSINAHAEVGELQLEHTDSKGVEHAFFYVNAPSTCVHDILVNIVSNTIYMCKDNFVHEVHGWNYLCILTTLVEHVMFFRCLTMFVLNSIINVDCVA